MSNDNNMMSPNEIREKISQFFAELEKTEVQLEHIQDSKRQIAREILNLQSKCPHKNKTSVWISDCAEMKMGKLCSDCKAQL